MDDRLSELKEKQAEIGDKISLLQETNRKKDEEAAEIRKLIAECRENLNRIKNISPGSEVVLPPCTDLDLESRSKKGSSRGTEGETGGRTTATSSCGESKRSAPSKPPSFERKPCPERAAKKKECKPPAGEAKQKKSKDKERISCRVDLNKMKVRVRGPSEDLKKLDATQLINLLEKFQCQELIINTGQEMSQDPGEIRLVYFLHPGNIVMAAGIVFVAFLINTNLCNPKRTPRAKLLFNLLYLSTFAFHYGMVLWSAFIRGYALKFGLSHDTFYLVDNLILPKYFFICVLLSALSLYAFLATHCVAPCSSWPLEAIAQMIVIVATFIMELITICYVVPALIKLRDATEQYAPDDEDPECSVPDSYEKNLVKLGKLNWTVCLINFLTLIFLAANLYYMTSKLNIGSSSSSSSN